MTGHYLGKNLEKTKIDINRQLWFDMEGQG